MIDANTPTTTPLPGGSGGGFGGGGGGGGQTTAGTVIPSVPSSIKVDTAIAEDRSFADLRDAQWARQAVEHLAEKQVIHGYEDGDFRPNNTITREDFVKIVMLAFEITPDTADAGFTDVSLEHWAHDYISGAKEAGIINGIGNHVFGTGANITRQDMAVILFQAIKYLQKAPGEKSVAFFTDHEHISEYATEAVYALLATDSIKGYADGSFGPQKNATRAEAAQMVYNVLNCLKQ